MGGFFSSPKPVLPAPLPKVSDSEDKEKKRRLKAMRRRLRGRASMIATSGRGIFGLAENAPRRKSLLGD